MTAVNKQDSNLTGLRYVEESSTIGVLPTYPVWRPLQPNSYDDFGGEISTVARNPINASRQRLKGVTVDLDASGGFSMDLTQVNLQDLLQGFCFADKREKGTSYINDDAAGRDLLVSQAFTAAASDICTTAAWELETGDGPYHVTTDMADLPDGLTVDTNYWIIAISTTTFKLAASHADALAGTAVDISDAGTGTHTIQNQVAVLGDADDEYIVNNPEDFQAGNLIFASGFTETLNNGLKVVDAVSGAEVSVTTNLTDESAAEGQKVQVVGWQGAAGELDIDASGTLPRMTSNGSAPNFTTLGIVPGEWVFIGGDTAGTNFSTAANAGWARVHAVAAGYLEFDKTQATFVTEADATQTVQFFYGDVIKNESNPTEIVRRSYQLERTLGAPDDASPAQIQSEYLVGAVANEFTMNFATADKITVDLGFIGTDHETRTGATGVKSGDRPGIVAEDAFNTSNDFARLKMSVLDRSAGSFPSALFGFLTEFNISINNNVTPNKAISVLGAFDMTAGQFIVEGEATAYFSSVAAISAIRDNSDVTLDFILVKENMGIVVDIPLIALGDGRLNVEQDQPITLPLQTPAAADEVFDHTLLFNFFAYLPDAAAA